jgi:hypothetical protein
LSDLPRCAPARVLESSSLRVYVRPDVGAKIAQIVDLRSGEALLVPPSKAYAEIPADKCWLDYDVSGLDDCFPNIAAGRYPGGRWAGTSLPDHGEWVYGAWEVDAATSRLIHLRRAGSVLPYSVRKTISLVHEDTIRFEYEVTNMSSASFRYLWAAHPLIRVDERGYRLKLPPGKKEARTLTAGHEFEWPRFHGIDLSTTWIAAGQTLKLFILDLNEGWCELELGHCTLRFEFDLATTPRLGIWLNNFGFPAKPQEAFRCVALEPCTSASDSLDELTADMYPTIAAGQTAAWSFTLKVGSPQ